MTFSAAQARSAAPITMNDHDTIPAELAGRFRSRLILKQDVFSTVERGVFATPSGEVEAVMRVLHGGNGDSAAHQFGDQLRQQGGLAGTAPAT